MRRSDYLGPLDSQQKKEIDNCCGVISGQSLNHLHGRAYLWCRCSSSSSGYENCTQTVVCAIHQPSIDIFEAFDELLLMKRGGEGTRDLRWTLRRKLKAADSVLRED